MDTEKSLLGSHGKTELLAWDKLLQILKYTSPELCPEGWEMASLRGGSKDSTATTAALRSDLLGFQFSRDWGRTGPLWSIRHRVKDKAG